MQAGPRAYPPGRTESRKCKAGASQPPQNHWWGPPQGLGLSSLAGAPDLLFVTNFQVIWTSWSVEHSKVDGLLKTSS